MMPCTLLVRTLGASATYVWRKAGQNLDLQGY